MRRKLKVQAANTIERHATKALRYLYLPNNETSAKRRVDPGFIGSFVF